MNPKEKEEFDKFINGLTPKERDDYIKQLSDETKLIVKIRRDNREYLDKISDIKLRYKEVRRLTNEYKEND